MTDWLPVLVMFVVAVGFALASLGASYLLSPTKATPEQRWQHLKLHEA